MELLDANENYLSSLTSPEMIEQDKKKGWMDQDPTAQSTEVTLPSEECQGCTVS